MDSKSDYPTPPVKSPRKSDHAAMVELEERKLYRDVYAACIAQNMSDPTTADSTARIAVWNSRDMFK